MTVRDALWRGHCVLCHFLCGNLERDKGLDLPFEVREQSHALANEVTKLIQTSSNIRREANAIDELVQTLRNRGHSHHA